MTMAVDGEIRCAGRGQPRAAQITRLRYMPLTTRRLRYIDRTGDLLRRLRSRERWSRAAADDHEDHDGDAAQDCDDTPHTASPDSRKFLLRTFRLWMPSFRPAHSCVNLNERTISSTC